MSCARPWLTSEEQITHPESLTSGRTSGCRCGKPRSNPGLGRHSQHVCNGFHDLATSGRPTRWSQVCAAPFRPGRRQLQGGLGSQKAEQAFGAGLAQVVQSRRVKHPGMPFRRFARRLVEAPRPANGRGRETDRRTVGDLHGVEEDCDEGESVPLQQAEPLESIDPPIDAEGVHRAVHLRGTQRWSPLPNCPRFTHDLSEMRRGDGTEHGGPQLTTSRLVRRPRNRAVRTGEDGEGHCGPRIGLT